MVVGCNPREKGNAVSAANIPNLNRYWSQFPATQIQASGLAVGLPTGQMGNSEVGHLNLGAGRVVYQNFTKISLDVEQGKMASNKALSEACDKALASGGKTSFTGTAV